MKSRIILAAGLAALLLESAVNGQILLEENFDGLAFGQVVNEAPPELPPPPPDAVWSKTGPDGWSVDDSAMPAGGVTEWAGWSFADPDWWQQVAGDQDRSQFLFGTGTGIAVADGDEWDDLANENPDNMSMDSTLITPEINIGGGAAELEFNASWRPDGTQKATVTAVYGDGSTDELLFWTSEDGPNFKDNIPGGEIQVLDVPNAGGSDTVQFEFRYFDAGNHWWWAVDDVLVNAGGSEVFFEDFDALTLGPPVDEGADTCGTWANSDEVWTDQGPDGWNVDDSGVPGVNDGDDMDGVTEWAGWSFADRNWWCNTAGDQNRSQFTNASGGVAVADPDEWDDQGHADSESNGWYQTSLTTPEVSLDGVGDSVNVAYDSSWRPEDDSNFKQSGRMVATFTMGDGSEEEVEVFRWVSDVSSGAHETWEYLDGDLSAPVNTYPDNSQLNDALSWDIDKPDGAVAMSVEFEMFDAGNDWWWAIDNLVISGDEGGGGQTCGDFDMDGDVDAADRTIQTVGWTGAIGDGSGTATFADGDCDGDGDVDTADQTGLIGNWTGAQEAGNLTDGDDADLVYDPATGNVTIDASDTAAGQIISFVIGTDQNNMDTSATVVPFIDAGTNTDNTPFQIGQTDPLNQGAGPLVDIGNVLPTGMDLTALSEYLTIAEYASELGAGGTLDLRVVPEPSSMVLALFGVFGLLRRRRK